MIYDSIYGYIKGYNRIDFFLHHLFLIVMILEVLINHKSGNEIIYCLLIGELTNPFMNIASILEYKDGNYGQIRLVL